MGNKITLEQACDELGISKRSLLRLISSGQLAAVGIGNRQRNNRMIRINRDDLEKSRPSCRAERQEPPTAFKDIYVSPFMPFWPSSRPPGPGGARVCPCPRVPPAPAVADPKRVAAVAAGTDNGGGRRCRRHRGGG